MSNVDTVRASMDAYRDQDLEAATRLLAEDFTFTSPQDDHIDKSAYLERCFPTADRFTASEIVAIVPAGDDSVLVLYEYELTNGECYRNTEYITVRNGQLVETQVFFGGRV
jgi:ketosteroid isomerase-like protein